MKSETRMRHLSLSLLVCLLLGIPPAWPAAPLSLEQALKRVYQDNPDLRRLRRESARAAARLLQAGLPANPELQFVSEDFAGSAAFSDDRFTQFTLELAQSLPLGDRLARERELGRLSQQLLDWNYRLQQLALARDGALAWNRLQQAQAAVQLLTRLRALAAEARDLVALRVAVGKAPPVAGLQAEQQLQELVADQATAEGQLELAGLALAGLWGDSVAVAAAEPPVLSPPPPLAGLLPRLAQHPRLARWNAEAAWRQAGSQSAEAAALPDLSLGGGLRYHPPLDWGLVLNLGLPLPVFQQNQAGRAESRLREADLPAERAEEQASLENELRQAHARAGAGYVRWQALGRQLTLAEQAYALERLSFEAGKIDALTLLRSLEAVLRTQRQQLEAETEARAAAVELAALAQLLPPPLAALEAGD